VLHHNRQGPDRLDILVVQRRCCPKSCDKRVRYGFVRQGGAPTVQKDDKETVADFLGSQQMSGRRAAGIQGRRARDRSTRRWLRKKGVVPLGQRGETLPCSLPSISTLLRRLHSPFKQPMSAFSGSSRSQSKHRSVRGPLPPGGSSDWLPPSPGRRRGTARRKAATGQGRAAILARLRTVPALENADGRRMSSQATINVNPSRREDRNAGSESSSDSGGGLNRRRSAELQVGPSETSPRSGWQVIEAP
jgi:hypothetical protein